jgi:hypothetical protein
MPPNECTKNNDGHGKERKRSRKPSSPSNSSESPKRRRKRGKERKKQQQQQQQHGQQKQTLEEIVEIATSALRQENQAWRDGTHADLPKTIRTIREQRVKEDCCIICLGGAGGDGGDNEPPVEIFSACCGQPYHASCYLKQLAWAKKSSSGNSNKCGVCRKLLPKLESGICEPATPATANGSFIGGLGGRHDVLFNWRNYSFSSSSSDSSSSDSSSSSSDDDDDDDDDDDSDTSSEECSDDSSSSSSSSSSSGSSSNNNNNDNNSSSSSDDDDDDDTPRYVSRVHAARTASSESASLERWLQRLPRRDHGRMVITRRGNVARMRRESR